MSAEGKGLLARETVEALRPHPPFDRMAADILEWMARRLALAYFADGAELVGPASGVVSRLHIVRQGVVQARPSAELPRADLVDLVHGPGECFPVGALLGRRASAYHYVARGDVFVYELAEADFRHLLDASLPFRAFCTDHLAALVQQSRQLLRAQAAESLADQAVLMAPVRRVGHAPALSCAPTATIREALEAMHRQRVGSVVVVDERRRPVGIFTQADVIHRVALAGKDLAAPIAQVMTPSPVTLDTAAPAYAAALEMTKRGIRHVILVEDGKAWGMVSERDLFALQRVSLNRSAKAIRDAGDYATLAAASVEVRQLAGQLLAHGMTAQEVTALITSLNDAIAQRAIELAAARYAPGGRFCWLAFGSEGRQEQTLATDQDNGLVLEDGAAVEAWLPFAKEVNEALDRCGFPLCKGGVMAGNPLWCLTLGDWLARFTRWIDNPLPEALLKAAIFFDFRPLAGEADFARALRAHLTTSAPKNRAFLRAMAENALQTRPPLGLLGDIEVDAEQGGTVDLKKLGARPFVDAARVWSLAQGRAETGTAERLFGAASAGALPADEAASAAQAFHFVQGLRLRHQLFERPAPGAENRIRPQALSSLDRRVLKEALRYAALLQRRLRLDFAL